MKKLLFSFFLILVSISLHGQPNAGSVLFNISGTAQYENQIDHNVFSVTLQPKVGQFLNKYFCLGIQTGLGYGHEKIMSEITGVSGSYGFNTNAYVMEIGPFVRFYYPANRHSAFIHSAFLYQHVDEITKTDYRDYNNMIKTNGGCLQLGIGYTYFITQNIGIELLPTYQWTFNYTTVTGNLVPTSGAVSGNSETKKFVVTLGLQFYVGNISKKTK